MCAHPEDSHVSRWVLIWAIVCLFAAVAVAAPSLEDQVNAIAGDLMCPVCEGQTVAESNALLAQQMREIIRERLRRGENHEQILAFFVTQFGESVLATPPKRGATLALWLAPLAVFALGTAGVLVYLRRMVRVRPRTAR